MTRIRTSARRAAPLAVAALLTVAACGPITPEQSWSSAELGKENKVLFLHQSHVVLFEPGKAGLSPGESDRLAAFLAREQVRRSDRVSIIPAADPAAKRPLAQRRADSIAAYLGGLGLKPKAEPESTAQTEGTVMVVVGRYVVIPPNCPDWRKSTSYDPGNTPSSNFGCADATNLGLMVADPGDLVNPQPEGAEDGERAASAIERYRKGKEKWSLGGEPQTGSQMQTQQQTGGSTTGQGGSQ